jgi:hypothetical protein
MSVTLYGSGQTIIQTVTASITGDTSVTATGYVSTGLYATITPQSTSSKILVLVNSGCSYCGSSGVFLNVQIWRGTSGQGSGSVIGSNPFVASFGSNNSYFPSEYSVLDSPSSTSSLTYTVMQQVSSGGNRVGFLYSAGNYTNASATITLLEISGS